MDTRTGEILTNDEAQLSDAFPEAFVEVSEDEMTPKQRKERRVSLNDHRSQLGKKLTYERKQRKIGRNEPCSCGSGLKYKKCCLK